MLNGPKEFLGDWVTLMGHQKACHQIITDLFTPQTIMRDETSRQIFRWYIRFELFAGTMSGGSTNLPQEWVEASLEYHKREARANPHDLSARFEECFAMNRALAADFTILMKTKLKNEIAYDRFIVQANQLMEQITAFGKKLRNMFTDSSTSAKSCFMVSLPDDLRHMDSDGATPFYSNELFTMNFVLLDFWTVELMVKQQILQESQFKLAPIALKQCSMVEAVQVSDQARTGALIACQAAIGMASLFLPQEQRYIDWVRRKFASIEQSG